MKINKKLTMIAITLPLITGQAIASQGPAMPDPNAALFSGSSSGGASNAQAAYDDNDCSQTKKRIEDTIAAKRKKADDIREKTATDPEQILKGLETCVSGLGTAFKNPFGIPSNPWGSLGNSACNYITGVFANNPLSNAVNNFSISDPTGTFSYNPQFNVGQNGGKYTNEKSVTTNDISQKVSGEIIKQMPGNSSVWSGMNINTSNYTIGQ